MVATASAIGIAGGVVLVEDALQIVAQLIPVIQNAVANGQTAIPATTWSAAIQSRDAALAQLDSDIAAVDGKTG